MVLAHSKQSRKARRNQRSSSTYPENQDVFTSRLKSRTSLVCEIWQRDPGGLSWDRGSAKRAAVYGSLVWWVQLVGVRMVTGVDVLWHRESSVGTLSLAQLRESEVSQRDFSVRK